MTDYKAVQQRLNDLGANPPLVVDGSYGPKSRAAVMDFQRSKGLQVDGIVGPMTLAALGIGSTTPTPAPSSGPIVDTSIPPGEIANRMTPMSPDQAAKAISDGYLAVTGKRPSAIILGLLLGQTALETGNWKSIHNYNFGNKKASGGDRNWQFFRCSEIINGKEEFFDPPDPHCKFSAYTTAAEGAAAYIRLLQSRPHWWASTAPDGTKIGLQSGTVDGFIKGLTTAPAYFTASPSLYRNVLLERMNNYAALAKQYAGAAAGIGAAVAVGLGGLGWLAWRFFTRS